MVHGIKFGGAERGETFPDIEVPAPASNFNVEDLLSEIAKLRDQVAAVELAAKRLASRPAPSSGRADSAARAAGKYANHIEHSHRKDEPE